MPCTIGPPLSWTLEPPTQDHHIGESESLLLPQAHLQAFTVHTIPVVAEAPLLCRVLLRGGCGPRNATQGWGNRLGLPTSANPVRGPGPSIPHDVPLGCILPQKEVPDFLLQYSLTPMYMRPRIPSKWHHLPCPTLLYCR